MRSPDDGAPFDDDIERAAIHVDGAPNHRRQVREISLAEGTGDMTEFANAERFVGLFRYNLLFVNSLGGWFCWDGRRWVLDESTVYAYAADTLRRMAIEAMKQQESARNKDETERATARLKWAERSQSARSLEAMVKLGSRDTGIRRTPDNLDYDPWLFNCMNGTIDLRTGTLRKHDQVDFITKLSPVNYDPNAPLDRWLEFLSTATRCDEELMRFLQRAAGYSLTGDTAEEKLFFIFGPSGSAKSTFVDAISTVMGDYAMSAAFDTWAQRTDAGSQRPDLARLVGARMVCSSETSPDRRLDEGVISNATGGDKINACHKYKDPFDYTPKFKLWLITNKRPRVNDMSDETGLWRRLLCLPFENKIPKHQQDSTVKAHFKNPIGGAPAVLRWAVEGCIEYLKEGRLAAPTRVTEATEQYRGENDPIRDFVSTRCVLTPGDKDAFISKSRLREMYEQWAKEEGQKHMLQTSNIAKRLRVAPYNCVESQRWMGSNRNIRVWYGLRERTTADEVEETQPANPGAGEHQETT